MSATIIYSSKLFRLTSFGDGLAYCLENKRSNRDVFVQGDDARDFREELEMWETHEPDRHYDLIYADMFHDRAA